MWVLIWIFLSALMFGVAAFAAQSGVWDVAGLAVLVGVMLMLMARWEDE